jgi:hypothetical protein
MMRIRRQVTPRLTRMVLVLALVLVIACLPWFAGYSTPRFNTVIGRAQFSLRLRYEAEPDHPVIVESYGSFFSLVSPGDLLFQTQPWGNVFTRRVARVSVLDGTYYFDVLVVLWAPMVLAVGAGLWLVCKDRRLRQLLAGCCKACGYNLTGNTSGTCPECGTPIAS